MTLLEDLIPLHWVSLPMLNETDETFKLIRNEIVDVTNFFINDCLYGKSSEVF